MERWNQTRPVARQRILCIDSISVCAWAQWPSGFSRGNTPREFAVDHSATHGSTSAGPTPRPSPADASVGLLDVAFADGIGSECPLRFTIGGVQVKQTVQDLKSRIDKLRAEQNAELQAHATWLRPNGHTYSTCAHTVLQYAQICRLLSPPSACMLLSQ